MMVMCPVQQGSLVVEQGGDASGMGKKTEGGNWINEERK